ncbi:hypothetical protein P154DRAFT_575274 [Amniculicola lignicola CBS 123094]|uniref:Uncharacterized protein n=1 Tax=Amniculicola lignicola CBS 123094 TaxID=1392246 RepID=A0A6A5WJU1_9PLEO|nr:hypothetical protein P154DRAFT_575274 [Amniculicola lignicola CBS 123094]
MSAARAVTRGGGAAACSGARLPALSFSRPPCTPAWGSSTSCHRGARCSSWKPHLAAMCQCPRGGGDFAVREAAMPRADWPAGARRHECPRRASPRCYQTAVGAESQGSGPMPLSVTVVYTRRSTIRLPRRSDDIHPRLRLLPVTPAAAPAAVAGHRQGSRPLGPTLVAPKAPHLRLAIINLISFFKPSPSPSNTRPPSTPFFAAIAFSFCLARHHRVSRTPPGALPASSLRQNLELTNNATACTSVTVLRTHRDRAYQETGPSAFA